MRAISEPEDRVVEVSRHHADNLVGLAVQFRGPAENISFAAKTSLPQVVTQHHDGSRPWAIFFLAERATERRRNSERIEVPGRDLLHQGSVGLVKTGQRL